jgi:ADP-heptose:LPS heptosyltransferase
MPAPQRQPIVIWFGRVGDMIMLSALLAVLHRRYGGSCRIIGAGEWTARIYATHPDVGQVCCLHRHRVFLFDARWWRAVALLRRARDAPVYVCDIDARKLRRIRRLLAVSGTAASRCVFMTEELEAARERGEPLEHWVDRLCALARRTPRALREADFPWPAGPAGSVCGPRLEVTPQERAQCQDWLRAKGWLGRPLVLIQPGNQRTMRGKRRRAADDKFWPIERWAALLMLVHEHMPQAILVLVGAQAEIELLGRIRAAAKAVSVATAELPLRELFALCERAHSMISVDSGPAHAAAAMGLPLVVLFGPHPAREWQPRGAVGAPVIGIGGPPASTRMDQISEREAFEGWRSLLSAMARRSPGAPPLEQVEHA